MTCIFMTGISGVGKSTVIQALAASGHRAVDLDGDDFSVMANVPADDPLTLEPGRDWVWDEARVSTLLASASGDQLFLSGCAPNQRSFYDRFDRIILLSSPAPVIIHRLATRSNNPYGKRQAEVERVLALKDAIEPLIRRGATDEIDTSPPLDAVVEEVLRIARQARLTPR